MSKRANIKYLVTMISCVVICILMTVFVPRIRLWNNLILSMYIYPGIVVASFMVTYASAAKNCWWKDYYFIIDAKSINPLSWVPVAKWVVEHAPPKFPGFFTYTAGAKTGQYTIKAPLDDVKQLVRDYPTKMQVVDGYIEFNPGNQESLDQIMQQLDYYGGIPPKSSEYHLPTIIFMPIETEFKAWYRFVLALRFCVCTGQFALCSDPRSVHNGKCIIDAIRGTVPRDRPIKCETMYR